MAIPNFIGLFTFSFDNEEGAGASSAHDGLAENKNNRAINRIRIMNIVISDHGAPSNAYINKIKLVMGDISKQNVDAVVSMISTTLDFSGHINEALGNGAGAELDKFILENIYKPKACDVYAVPSFDLPCKNIIFAVRPNWRSDIDREDKHLVMCVRKSMVLAKCMLLNTIAFPPLASGKGGYPKPRAARILIQSILDRLDERIQEVRIVCPDQKTYDIYKERLFAKGWDGN